MKEYNSEGEELSWEYLGTPRYIQIEEGGAENTELEPGFYFSDEVEQLRGPHSTLSDAMLRFKIYVKELG